VALNAEHNVPPGNRAAGTSKYLRPHRIAVTTAHGRLSGKRPPNIASSLNEPGVAQTVRIANFSS